MARITVVTAAKNAEVLLPETIASIQAQTMRDWRMVIVDDGSTDATAARAQSFAEADDRIEVRSLGSSIGPYAAANTVMLQADSAFLARIDADDLAPPNRFERQLEALGATSAKASTGGWRAMTNGSIGSRVRRVPTRRNGVLKWTMWMRSTLVHSTLMIDTATFHERGGYGPEPVGEDFRLWAWLARTNRLSIIDEPLVDYRFSEGQMTSKPGATDEEPRLRIRLDHMTQCAPEESWSIEDARDFRHVGRPASFPARRALALLDRWETQWQRDRSIDAADRAELTALGATMRLGHLRHAVRKHPIDVVAASVRGGPAVARAAALVARGKGQSWTT